MITNIALIAYAALILLCLLAYAPKLKQLFYGKSRIKHSPSAQMRRISLVVPARNESGVVEDLLRSVAKQDYPKEFFDVNVIVNDGDDPTVQIAKAYGARVFVVPEQTCKGDALDGYFSAEDKRVFSSYAAFVIVDADAVLSQNYLSRLNDALDIDAQIFLTRKNVKNFLGGKKERTLFSNCSALTYAQLDDLGNVYRTDHGMPLMMCGQGMMIRRETVEELGGWPYRTLTEDYEMRMDCFLRDYKSVYYPHAVIFTEEPLSHRENYIRRLRWVTGFSQSDKIYKKKIRAKAKARGKMTEGEREYFYALVPIIAYIVITAIAVLLGVGLCVYNAVVYKSGWLYPFLCLSVAPMTFTFLLLWTYAAMCMGAMSDSFSRIPAGERFVTLLYMPIFVFEYFPIFIQSRFKARKACDWKPTRHLEYGGDLEEVGEAQTEDVVQ